MGTINVAGKDYEVDEEGYLANLNDWNPDIAEWMAKDEDTELTENHWEVINFLREYYDEYQIAPAVRVLTKAIVNMQVCLSQLVAYNSTQFS